MDKVFIVYENYKVDEIFSNEEKATNYITEKKAEHNGHYYHYEEKEVK